MRSTVSREPGKLQCKRVQCPTRPTRVTSIHQVNATYVTRAFSADPTKLANTCFSTLLIRPVLPRRPFRLALPCTAETSRPERSFSGRRPREGGRGSNGAAGRAGSSGGPRRVATSRRGGGSFDNWFSSRIEVGPRPATVSPPHDRCSGQRSYNATVFRPRAMH